MLQSSHLLFPVGLQHMCVVLPALPWTREHNCQFRSYLFAKYSLWTSIPTIIAGWWARFQIARNPELLFTLVASYLFHCWFRPSHRLRATSRTTPRTSALSVSASASRHFKQGSCLQHGPNLPAFLLLSYEQLQVEQSLRYLLLASLRCSSQACSFLLKRYCFILLLL